MGGCKNEIKDGWQLMKMKIVIKSKVAIKVKRLSKYNHRSRVAVKQTNRHRETETGKYLGKEIKRHAYK